MAIHTEAIDAWVRYVPDFEDNRQDEDPCTVEIHPMSHAELREFGRSFKNAPAAVAKGDETSVKQYEKKVERIFEKRVRDVRGLVWYGREIRTGLDLATHGPSALCTDVFNALTDISKLSGDLKKGFGWALDSCKADTQPSTGAAADAGDQPT